MTYAELRRHVYSSIGLPTSTQNSELLQVIDNAIQQAHIDIGLEFQIPRYRTSFTGVTTSVTLPSVYPNGVLKVIDKSNGVDLPIMTIHDADTYAPNRFSWADGVVKFVEYNPAAPSEIVFRPTANPAIDVEVVYAAPPAELDSATSEPWSGQYAAYHRVIAVDAAIRVLQSNIARNLYGKHPQDALNLLVTQIRMLSGELQRIKNELADATSLGPFEYPRLIDWRA